MGPLDGNAMAGVMHDLFARDMTTMGYKCTSCGRTGVVAEMAVYMSGPGTVARCRDCDTTWRATFLAASSTSSTASPSPTTSSRSSRSLPDSLTSHEARTSFQGAEERPSPGRSSAPPRGSVIASCSSTAAVKLVVVAVPPRSEDLIVVLARIDLRNRTPHHLPYTPPFTTPLPHVAAVLREGRTARCLRVFTDERG
jgi:hypothetical protein